MCDSRMDDSGLSCQGYLEGWVSNAKQIPPPSSQLPTIHRWQARTIRVGTHGERPGVTFCSATPSPCGSVEQRYGCSLRWLLYGQGTTFGGCADYIKNLTPLIAPLYGWMFSITGNSKYQVEGDTGWQAGVSL